MTQAAIQNLSINGFNVAAVGDIVEQLTNDPSLAITTFKARSEWKGTAQVETRIHGYELGGQQIAREHLIRSDEPRELFGEDTAPNPQELLFAALNACMIFGYATTAATMGIRIQSLSIETQGSLDLRGPLGLAAVPVGMETIHYIVRIKADATPEQLDELHRHVMAHSPNRYHMSHPIRLAPKLVIE
jgi:uncharacterized OsmC-like protein